MTLRVPFSVLNSGDEELINTWHELLRLVGGEGDSAATLRNLFDANTILKADTDNSPEALTVGEGTMVGRKSGGSIAALTAAEIRTLADAQQDLDLVSQAEAEAGTATTERVWTAERIKQAIAALETNGGLVLEDTDTADGTAEHLQVTATSELTGIRRMVANFKNMVPEVTGDSIFFSVIMDDDSEFSTFVVLQFWGLIDGTFASGKSTSSTYGYGNSGNSGNESVSVKIELLNGNGTTGTQGQKVIEVTRLQDDSLGQDIFRKRILKINSTKSIKGFRWDTDNAGDMLTEGEAEIWVQS